MARFKLNEIEVKRLFFRGLISSEECDILIKTSLLRAPWKDARSKFELPLNKKGSIKLSSIAAFGGETFNQPYHFLAEITHETSNQAFLRFMTINGIPVRPFDY